MKLADEVSHYKKKIGEIMKEKMSSSATTVVTT